MVLSVLAVVLPITIRSNWFTPLVFGCEYAKAGPVLTVRKWTAIFVLLGVASGKWFTLDNSQIQNFYRTAPGAFINIGPNKILIPEYAALGAAVGALLSQIFAAYVFDLFGKHTRCSFWLKTSSSMLTLKRIRSRNYQ